MPWGRGSGSLREGGDQVDLACSARTVLVLSGPARTPLCPPGHIGKRHREYGAWQTEGRASWHGTASWASAAQQPPRRGRAQVKGAEVDALQVCVPGKSNLPRRPHWFLGCLLDNVAVLCSEGLLSATSCYCDHAARRCYCSPCSGPEASGPRPRRWASRLPRGLKLMAEPYDKASSAILHNCRAVPKWIVLHVCFVPLGSAAAH